MVANGVTFAQSILVICSLEQEDAAQYNCSASNNISTTSGSFDLTVNSIRMYTLKNNLTAILDGVYPNPMLVIIM